MIKWLNNNNYFMKDSFWKIINAFDEIDFVFYLSNDSLIIIQMNQIEMNLFERIILN